METGRLHTPLELIQLSAEYLAERGVPSPRLDAELLLAHVLDCTRLSLYTDHGRPVIPAELDRYRELIRSRGLRVPLQLLVGATRPGIAREATDVLLPGADRVVGAIEILQGARAGESGARVVAIDVEDRLELPKGPSVGASLAESRAQGVVRLRVPASPEVCGA